MSRYLTVSVNLTALIKAGTVAPSILMRRLAAYPKQNALAKTIREIGRLERTPFTRAADKSLYTGRACRRRPGRGSALLHATLLVRSGGFLLV